MTASAEDVLREALGNVEGWRRRARVVLGLPLPMVGRGYGNPKTKKAKWPQVECACGASWRGRYAVDNPVIDAHRKRELNGLKSEYGRHCKVTDVMPPVDHGEPGR